MIGKSNLPLECTKFPLGKSNGKANGKLHGNYCIVCEACEACIGVTRVCVVGALVCLWLR